MIKRELCVGGSQEGVLEEVIPRLSLQGSLRVIQLGRGNVCRAKEIAGAKAGSLESHVWLVAGVGAAHLAVCGGEGTGREGTGKGHPCDHTRT